jgi:hypothetical protein
MPDDPSNRLRPTVMHGLSTSERASGSSAAPQMELAPVNPKSSRRGADDVSVCSINMVGIFPGGRLAWCPRSRSVSREADERGCEWRVAGGRQIDAEIASEWPPSQRVT